VPVVISISSSFGVLASLFLKDGLILTYNISVDALTLA
jgi:hypothetical protein